MATPTQGKWVKLDQKGTGPGARSSHTITLVGNKVYAFGGEFTPRVPIDNNLYIFDLQTLTWSIAATTGETPSPRLGLAMAAIGATIYVFGGRDSTNNQLNELYAFSTQTNEWKLLSNGDMGPTHRSYHSIAADDQNLYVFGGCGVGDDRLNDLWAYNVNDQKWIQYPNPGEACKARGGPGLAVVQGKIWVVYGFRGVEMDDVHCFDPVQGEWTQVETTGEKPSARSVFATAVVGNHILIFGGEVEPSPLMHLGAGKYSREIYGLDTETLVWTKSEAWPEEEQPGPRGWCAFANAVDNKKERLLVHGGNSPSNDPLDDIFFFTPY